MDFENKNGIINTERNVFSLSCHDGTGMDDNTKIKTLMIYYEHWGKDEIRAQKVVHGLGHTMSQLKEGFLMENDRLYDQLNQLFTFYSHDLLDRWNEIAQRLLGETMCFSHGEEFLDEEDRLFDKKVILEHKLNIFQAEASDMIYNIDFGYENVLSVDAIIALM